MTGDRNGRREHPPDPVAAGDPVRGGNVASRALPEPAATRVGVSGATLSQWRRGSYPGDNEAVERKVRQWLSTEEEVEGRRLDAARLDVHLDLSVTGEITSLLTHAQAASTWC